MSKDFSHCPNDQYGNSQQYFSPVAPSDYCADMPTNTVPEPSTLVLLAVAFVVAIVVRKVRS